MSVFESAGIDVVGVFLVCFLFYFLGWWGARVFGRAGGDN